MNYAISILVLIFALGALAGDPNAQIVWKNDLPPAVKLVDVFPGQLPDVVFSDGRVATLVLKKTVPQVYSVPIDVVESSCGKNYPARCILNYPFWSYTIQLIWKKNSDPTKVGKALIRNGNPVFNEFNSFAFVDKLSFPALLQELQKPDLNCPNWSWLEPREDRIAVLEWTSELMIENLETRVNENRTTSVAWGIELSKKSEDSYFIGLPKKWVKTFGTNENFSLLEGNEIGWTVETKKSESCDVSFKANLSLATAGPIDKNDVSESVFHNDPFWTKIKKRRTMEIGSAILKNSADWPELQFLMQIKLFFASGISERDGVETLNLSFSEKEIQ